MSNHTDDLQFVCPVHFSSVDAPASPSRRCLLVKSLLDKAIASILFVLTSPIMLAAMIAVKLTSHGPVIYTQVRVGRNGALFRIYKIRSMFQGCEQHLGPQWSKPGDHRVTLVGRLLRSSHIDELPQFLNVLRGEMSLVGPRPERPEFVGQLEKALPRYRERLMVLPGITGLAQIQLKPDTDLRSVACKLICDLHYIQRMSGWLDLQILLTTPFYLLGIPFPVLHWLFRVPTIQTLECTCAQPTQEREIPRFLPSPAMEPAGQPLTSLFPSGAFRAGSHSSEKIRGIGRCGSQYE
jgi:lipopolysaccharide/colanic/teichoic acid biosynthesis glycosyltransferase